MLQMDIARIIYPCLFLCRTTLFDLEAVYRVAPNKAPPVKASIAVPMAVAAKANSIPIYATLPSLFLNDSSIDTRTMIDAAKPTMNHQNI